jgi:ABC-type nitrate/sulfonate/bicarbonate transport system permease component
LSAFFPMAINTMTGVRQINPLYFDVAKNYGATRLKLLTRVILPGSMPSVLAGARLAFNIGLTITTAVEIVTAQRGLGSLIWLAWETLRTEELYAALTLIAVLGIGMNWGLERLAASLLPWQKRTRHEHA